VKPGSRRTFGGILLTLADHNSCHLGQIVTLRRGDVERPTAALRTFVDDR
jgi:hypothetical protein